MRGIAIMGVNCGHIGYSADSKYYHALFINNKSEGGLALFMKIIEETRNKHYENLAMMIISKNTMLH